MTLPQLLTRLDSCGMNSALEPDARRILRGQAITLRAIAQRPTNAETQRHLREATEHAEYLLGEWT